MHIYIHVHMYVCMQEKEVLTTQCVAIYISIQTLVYIHIQKNTYTRMYKCIYIHIYIGEGGAYDTLWGHYDRVSSLSTEACRGVARDRG